MKHYYLVLTILLALGGASAAHAQPSGQAALSAHILKVQQLRTGRILDRVGIARIAAERPALEQMTYLTWDGVAWVPETRRTFAFDGPFAREEWTHAWDGVQWVNASRTIFSRHSEGTVYETLVEQWAEEQNAFVPASSFTYDFVYDWQTGAPLMMAGVLYREWDGTQWLAREKDTYTVANDGLYIIGGQSEWGDGEGNLHPVERFDLHQDGEDVVETWQTWNGETWVDTERTFYPSTTVPGLYQVLQELVDAFSDYAGLNLAFRLIPEHTRQEWDGGAWVNAERQIIDTSGPWSGGNPMAILYQTWMDGAWVNEMRQVLTNYTDTGKPASTGLHFFDGAGWAPILDEQYLYDSRGDMRTATQQVNDGEGLQNSAQYQFTWKRATSSEAPGVPNSYALDPAYPNPFNPQTTLTYYAAAPGPIAVRVYDTLGRHAATLFEGVQATGQHHLIFEANGLPGGIYFVRLEAAGYVQTRAVTLLK